MSANRDAALQALKAFREAAEALQTAWYKLDDGEDFEGLNTGYPNLFKGSFDEVVASVQNWHAEQSEN